MIIRFKNQDQGGVCWRGIPLAPGEEAFIQGHEAFVVNPEGYKLREYALVTKYDTHTVKREKLNSDGEIEFDDDGRIVYEIETSATERMEFVPRIKKESTLYRRMR